MIYRWVKKYIAEEDESFYHKGHPRNPFATLHTSKKMPELDRLRLMVVKLEIENERLKKGYQWTLLVDTFKNQILAHEATPIQGHTGPYFHCLEQLKQLVGTKEERTLQVVMHTDQGSVYSSRAFCKIHYNILCSMSQEGTPTDNPNVEALYSWIKEELYLDFDFASAEDVLAR